MLKKIILLFAIAFPFQLFAQQTVNIIPQPVSIKVTEGNFIIDGNTTIKFSTAQKESMAVANFFSSYIKNISGYALQLHKPNSKFIELKIKKLKDIGDEGHILNVSPSSIIISSNTKAGIIYGMQTPDGRVEEIIKI